MNHISKLQHDLDEARGQLRTIESELVGIERYLLSEKFSGPESDWVGVRTDILPKVSDLRSLTHFQQKD